MEGEKLTQYSIKGKVELEDLKRISSEVPILAYAVRDRRVLGSAPIGEDGSFEVNYKYKVFDRDRNKEPYGVDLIIGPELPGDQILKTKLERKFLSSKGFKKASPKFAYEIAESIKLSDTWKVEIDKIKPKCKRTYTGFVYTCSPLNIPPGGQAGCRSQKALSNADAEAYVRLWGIHYAEDIEIDVTGRFEKTFTWYDIHCLSAVRPTKVEVYQKTDDMGDHILYTGVHSFAHTEDIFIDRDKVEIIPILPNPTPGTGNYFGFERIGRIPVECVYKSDDSDLPGDDFIGYVDSSGDRPGILLGDDVSTFKDYAFGRSLDIYANIGDDFGQEYDGGVDMSEVTIKYFRIKYSYENPETGETIGDTYISVPYNKTRKIVDGTTTEFMGAFTTHPDTGDPLSHPTYIYPNPYETASDKDWKCRGLVLVLNTYTLPRKYGRYTFTIEPLDVDMNPPVESVANQNDCVLTLLIDNDHDALTGEIKEISYFDFDGIWKKTDVCDIADLKGVTPGTSNIKVKYTLNDSHGNLRDFELSARYGKGQAVDLTSNYYSRSGTTPYWEGVDEEVTENHAWQKCAYQFRIWVWRRVTNGLHTIHWKEFTYHISIDSNNLYEPEPV